MNAKKIRVKSAAGDYLVVCGRGLLHRAAHEIAELGKFSSVHVVSSPKVWRAVGKTVLRGLGRKNGSRLHLVPDGETVKTLRTAEKLMRALSRASADRRALLIAVGGGVVGDVAGFVAATYLRGIALVQVPTTIVAQVDSAVGGKTGVNLPEGKNLVGSFYPARRVIVDPDALRTLPKREFRGGLAEVIKYGVIADAKLFGSLERNFEKILTNEMTLVEPVIFRSLEIKAQVVGKDERESGLREILNFGHTFGHALESVTKYKRYQHGEAIAWGMMAAALLGHEIGITKADDVARIVALVRRMGKLPAWPRVPVRTLIDAMRSDKKTRGGRLRFVLAPKIGKARSYDDVPLDAVERVLRFTPKLAEDSGGFRG